MGHQTVQLFSKTNTAHVCAYDRYHKLQCRVIQRLIDGSRLNPKFGACFSDESFIGHISRGTRKGHAGQVAMSTVARYLLKMKRIISELAALFCKWFS